jgi:hypothetical protein
MHNIYINYIICRKHYYIFRRKCIIFTGSYRNAPKHVGIIKIYNILSIYINTDKHAHTHTKARGC